MHRPESMCRMRHWHGLSRWMGLALLLGAAATVQAAETAALGLSALTPRALAQALTLRNLELAYGRESVAVSASLAEAEAALYEPVLFASLKHSRTERQRTIDEMTANFTAASESLLDEKGRSLELGVRQRLSTGAELSLSARQSERSNNVLARANTQREATASLVLSFKQPLWRGRGEVVTETDRRVAELESEVVRWQYLQQLHKILAEGLVLYWQAQVATEGAHWRQRLLESSEALLQDAAQRIEAGKWAPRVQLELERVRLGREADLLRARQSRDELLIRLLSNLDLDARHLEELQLAPEATPMRAEELRNPEDSLAAWAPYRVAELRQRQGELRLAFADNQRMPVVDLVLTWGQSGLGNNQGRGAWPLARSGRFPEWYVGFNVELGAQGDRRAEAQWLAQQRRMSQADTEIAAIRQAFLNDRASKQQALQRVQQEAELLDREVQARQTLLADERQRFEAGMGLLSTLLQAEQDLMESRIRLADARGRLETARIGLLLAEGGLLSAHGIETPLPSEP